MHKYLILNKTRIYFESGDDNVDTAKKQAKNENKIIICFISPQYEINNWNLNKEARHGLIIGIYIIKCSGR